MSSPIFQNSYSVLKRCKHGYFLFNQNDTFIGRSLDLYGEWCEMELLTLCQMVKSGDMVIDVGANIGTHTIPLANMVTSSGLVLAFEPQRATYNYLTANLALNNLLHVVSLRYAVGEAGGVVRVPLFDPNQQTNFGAVNLENTNDGEPVDIVTIDSFPLERCNLIKIDVEGMEARVLAGAKETIHRLRPILFVETTMVNYREVIQTLLDHRYECWWHIAAYYNPNNFFENSENVFADIHPESNVLAFPKETNTRISGLEPVLGPEDNFQAALIRLRARK
jgi:FkbM family methyltransferase